MPLVRPLARSVVPLGALLALSVPLGLARQGHAQRTDTCIAPSVEHSLLRCERTRTSAGADSRGERPTSHLPSPIVAPTISEATPATPSPQLAPDRAPGHEANRALPLLEREIQTL